ncbi:flagellar biosynthetic protein FliP [Clostridium aceticum]|uniref:Flagellar biosynthetic protein FliP n=1 Tax=Clostridium aceticum TaxID=84022 RepID=A0A0G3WC41_9CLOT|nr:flagellar type III secretion system pore protein FliP [Clostridium aceticum]AKL95467.1 flagellar biosynthetic protein FliP [Clostridium aceticum]
MKTNIGTKQYSNNKKFILCMMILLVFLIISTIRVDAQPDLPIPRIGLTMEEAENPQEVVASIQILFLLTILSLAPAILIMMTSFTRIIIVLSFLRNALATQQTPPTQVLIGLTLFLTFFTMAPIASEINQNALQPYLQEEIGQTEAWTTAMEPIREFMLRQTREKDLALFAEIANIDGPVEISEITNTVLIPAFIISELKTAFQLGFVLFIPFIVIDMVVASTLMSMGMMMLPPAMISLPFKLLLFIMVDGWNILIRSLITSFR